MVSEIIKLNSSRKGCLTTIFECHLVFRFNYCVIILFCVIFRKNQKLPNSKVLFFSNGLLDPWSAGGVLKSVSFSVRALLIPDAAHHLDLRAAHANDTTPVIQTRKQIKLWIKKWIHDYKHAHRV